MSSSHRDTNQWSPYVWNATEAGRGCGMSCTKAGPAPKLSFQDTGRCGPVLSLEEELGILLSQERRGADAERTLVQANLTLLFLLSRKLMVVEVEISKGLGSFFYHPGYLHWP